MKLNSKTLRQILKQRYDDILVDQVLDLSSNTAVGLKNVSTHDCQLRTTSLGDIYLAESKIIDGFVQTSFVLFSQHPELATQDYRIKAIKHAEFFQSIQPGDQLRLEVQCEKGVTDNSAEIHGTALVNGEIMGEAKIQFQFTKTPSKPQIHPTAWVHPTAVLGQDVIIGAYTIVGEQVVIGDRTVLEAHVMVNQWTQIGEDCHIYFGTVIGSIAQDTKYNGEKTLVKIGDRNTIREYVTINRATGAESVTEIGHDNLIFTGSHIGHNCRIGNHVIITNLSQLGGHVDVEDFAVIGGNVGIHQFVRIGTGSMIGGYSRIVSDVPPFILCEGNPAEVKTLNTVGLKRRGAKLSDLNELKVIFKTLFRGGLNTQQAMEKLQSESIQSPYATTLIHFFKTESKRGILKRT